MVIIEEVRDEAVEAATAPPPAATTKRSPLRAVAFVAGALVVGGIVATIATVADDSDPPAPVSTAAPVQPSRDDVVVSLVERGIVPAATLDDGSQIGAGDGARSQDQFVRDLVARGVVPAATLDDGSGIAG